MQTFADIRLPLAFVIVDGVLQWNHPSFYNGTAGFCQIDWTEVFVTFTAAGGPPGCDPVELVVYAGQLPHIPGYFIKKVTYTAMSVNQCQNGMIVIEDQVLTTITSSGTTFISTGISTRTLPGRTSSEFLGQASMTYSPLTT